MKENDYYGHYKAFVMELSRKPNQTLQVYCRENGVVWRRLYDWMRRHHISLKSLYCRGLSQDSPERRWPVFSLDEKVRFYLCQQPVSMRYGIRGLTNIVLAWPGFSPMSGCAFVFFSADRRQVERGICLAHT